MHSTLKYSLKAFGIAAILYGLAYLSASLSEIPFISLLIPILVFNWGLSILIYHYFKVWSRRNPDWGTNLIFGFFVIKVLLFMLFAVALILVDKENANENVVALLFCYLVFTAFETFHKWNIIRGQSGA